MRRLVFARADTSGAQTLLREVEAILKAAKISKKAVSM